jgi:hypothetical protein
MVTLAVRGSLLLLLLLLVLVLVLLPPLVRV